LVDIDKSDLLNYNDVMFTRGNCAELMKTFWPCNFVKRDICYENVCPSVRLSHSCFTPYYTVRQKKTAPFYFCNSFVRTSSFMTMFGTRIHQ